MIFEKAFTGKPAERFAHGCARYPELRRQNRLLQRLTARQLAGADVFAQREINAFR
jgi:hypothetical protein